MKSNLKVQSSFDHSEKDVSVNFLAEKKGKETSVIMAYVSFGKKQKVELKSHLYGMIRKFNSGQTDVIYKNINEPVKDKYERIKISTGISLLHNLWNKEKKEAIGTDSEKINKELISFNLVVNKVYKQLQLSDEEITADKLRKLIIKGVRNDSISQIDYTKTIAIEPVIKLNRISFYDFIGNCISKEKTDAKSGTGDITLRSLVRFISFHKRFGKYQEEKGIVYLDEINQNNVEDVAREYFNWFMDYGKKNKTELKIKGDTYDDNTLNQERTAFKKYIYKAAGRYTTISKDIIKDTKPLKKRKPKFQKPNIYLSLQELEAIEKVDCCFFESDTNKNSDEYEKVRSYFLLNCFGGGRRISDYPNLVLIENPAKPGKFYLDDINQKTGNYVQVPASQKVITHYNRLLNYGTKNVKGEKVIAALPNHFNLMLQTICRAAKIDTLIPVDKSGKRVKKSSIITAHSGRKTYCTNFIYEYKINPNSVAKLAGLDLQTMLKHYVGAPLKTAYDEVESAIENFSF